jgi:hypothetical protein
LRAGEQQPLAIEIPAEQRAVVDEDGVARAGLGRFRLTVGGGSPGARGVALGLPEPQSAEFTVAAQA